MLNKLRQKINSIDNQILTLLGMRIEVSRKIKKFKIYNDLTVLDKLREKELLDFWKKIGESQNLNNAFLVNLFKLITRESRRIQNEK